MNLVLVEKPQPYTTVVTLNRPERLNAMSIDLVIELDDRLNEIAADNDTRVVILTGAGRAFCAGQLREAEAHQLPAPHDARVRLSMSRMSVSEYR